MKKIMFALIAGATAMSAAQAQMISKPYVGLGVASAKHELPGATSSDGTKAAGKIFVGADVNQTFGVEAGHSMSKADHTYSLAGVNGTAETKTRRSYLAAKATMPVNEQFSVYGKLGAAHVKTKAASPTVGSGSESDNGVYAGVGAQYAMTENVALSLEYERYGKKKDFGAKPDAVSVNAKYSF